MKEWKKVFYANGNQKKAVVAILASDKRDFKPKNGNKKQRKSLCDDKGVSSSRRCNNHKYIDTHHHCT